MGAGRAELGCLQRRHSPRDKRLGARGAAAARGRGRGGPHETTPTRPSRSVAINALIKLAGEPPLLRGTPIIKGNPHY